MDRNELRRLLAGDERLVRSEGDGLDVTAWAETVKPEDEELHTRQSEADAADINKILKRFESSGILPLSNREGAFLDVSEVGDYRGALEQVRRAGEYFATLPADSRAMFDNDPAVFLDKVQGGNLDLLVKAGVVPKGEVIVPDGGAGAPADAAAPSS